MSKEISYENFKGCCEYTDDSYWHDIFNACSKNKFPKGIKYDVTKNTISVKYTDTASKRPKVESFQLPVEIKKLYTLMMKIFKGMLHLTSTRDMKNSRAQIKKESEKNVINLDCTWKELKPRSVRNYLLMDYAIECSKKYNIDCKDIFNTIQLGFLFKSLQNEDVQYEDGKILNISGLSYKEELSTFILTNPQKQITRVDKVAVKKNKLNQSIDKWIRDYKNHHYHSPI